MIHPHYLIMNETPRSKLRGISPRLTSFVISLLRSKLRGIKPEEIKKQQKRKRGIAKWKTL